MGHHLTDFDYGFAKLKSGDVLKVVNDGGAFGDALVLGFSEAGEAKLSRPYAYVSGAGTTGPTVLLGAETFTVTAYNIKHYPVVESRDRGRVT